MAGPDPARLLTFREIDSTAGRAKGAAFRCFKRLDPAPVEGRDFHLLRPETDSEQLDSLRRAGRIYPSSINVVLMEPDTAKRVEQALDRSVTL
jgi:hypothetical protein